MISLDITYKHWARFAIALGVLAFVVRILFIFFYTVHPLAGGDPTAFWTFAQGIASGQGFRSTYEPWLADRPPLYSFFLAGVFLVFGEKQNTVFVVQALLGAVAAFLFYLCVLRILDSRRALVGGLLFAVWPHFLLMTKQILTEAIYIPILVGFLFVLIYPRKTSLARFALAGVLLGALALVRREAIFPAILIACGLIWLRAGWDWKRLLQAGSVLVICTALILLPWLIRNWIVLGSPMLSSSGGWNFMVGNNPASTGSYALPPEWVGEFNGLGELERNQRAWDLSLGWIRAYPYDFLALLPHKLAYTFGPAHNLVLDFSDLAIAIFAVLGLFKILHREPDWPLVAAIAIPLLLSITLIGLVFVGMWRYRLAIYPGWLLLAAYGTPQVWLNWAFEKTPLARFDPGK